MCHWGMAVVPVGTEGAPHDSHQIVLSNTRLPMQRHAHQHTPCLALTKKRTAGSFAASVTSDAGHSVEQLINTWHNLAAAAGAPS